MFAELCKCVFHFHQQCLLFLLDYTKVHSCGLRSLLARAIRFRNSDRLRNITATLTQSSVLANTHNHTIINPNRPLWPTGSECDPECRAWIRGLNIASYSVAQASIATLEDICPFATILSTNSPLLCCRMANGEEFRGVLGYTDGASWTNTRHKVLRTPTVRQKEDYLNLINRFLYSFNI
jgi:hypothetical protein